MAQVKLLKIGADGLQEEFNSASDDITLASYTVNGSSASLSATGLDMQNTDITLIQDITFNDPTTGTITDSSGAHVIDKLMFADKENSIDVGSAILFPTISDAVDEVDAFRLPTLAGTPSAAPADGGEGYLVWDSTNNKLYAYDGSAWDDLSTVTAAEKVCNVYTTGEAIAIGEVLYISAANTVSKADASTNYEAMGFAKTADGVGGSTIEVQSEGIIEGLAGLTAGSRYFLDTTAGAVTATAPTGSGSRVLQVGFAKNTTDLHIQFDFVGRRA
jgi:hypothetical protein